MPAVAQPSSDGQVLCRGTTALKTTKTSHPKRIKRHIIGRVRDYFAVNGGVEFRGRLVACHLANLCLATATRVLMRIDRFKATRFDTLEKRAAEIPWEIYLHPGTPVDCRAATSKSRLYHSDAIVQRVKTAIAKRMADFTAAVPEVSPSAGSRETLFVRAEEDLFTFSLDSSGKALYKRGLKTQGGRAPLRETLAAALLMRMGYTGREVLLDPMCGTGTFSLEAAFKILNVPRGWFRGFAFSDWPAFRPAAWASMLRQHEKQFADPPGRLVHASDHDADACESLRQTVDDAGLAGVISVSRRNFFDLSPDDITSRPGCIVINPPYGIRLGDPAEAAEFRARLYEKLQTEFTGWQLGLVVPAGARGMQPPFPMESLKVLQGGLRLKLCTGTITGA